MIGNPVEGPLYIDETGFPKQGSHSVSVQRQYSGQLSKVENCQVGVVLGHFHKNQRISIDGQLYLPREWAKAKSCGTNAKFRKTFDSVPKPRSDWIRF
ncbi:MAG: hypothetical protein E4G89_05215 [Methanothrix sp.]|nr:MAG: hypothetical protein E4G89_05215 [Methanothrix sp.]